MQRQHTLAAEDPKAGIVLNGVQAAGGIWR